jgi:hypothetical protein
MAGAGIFDIEALPAALVSQALFFERNAVQRKKRAS